MGDKRLNCVGFDVELAYCVRLQKYVVSNPCTTDIGRRSQISYIALSVMVSSAIELQLGVYRSLLTTRAETNAK